MKRTGEIVLSVIGTVFYALSAVLFGLMMALFNNEQFIQEMENETAPEDLEYLYIGLDFINASGVIAIGIVILAAILGIVSTVLLKGDKNPKVAGIILLATSILASVITLGVAIFPSIFLFIAGIMALVRKAPQAPIEQQF